MLKRQLFQQSLNGKQTDLFFLKNKAGIEVAITNFGARIVGLWVPDKKKNSTDIVAGFDNLDEYKNADCPYYGATIGRYANRIAHGQFNLNDKTLKVTVNEGENHLHGGLLGFHNVVWNIAETKSNSLKLNYFSPDGEEGYPGNLSVNVHFSLNEDNELKIIYEAHCDKESIINLTNHAFFNLNGETGTILNHKLVINADFYTPIDEQLIPTGTIESVNETPFDFRSFRTIGERINVEHEQIRLGNGYDHNFVLNKESKLLSLAAKIKGDQSGIEMTILTTEPGLQFYSGNMMKGINKFKNGSPDNFRTAIALETQHFPDSPNHKSFPSVKITPGKVFKSSSIYRFNVVENENN